MSTKRGVMLPFRITPGDADVATATGPTLREAHLTVVLGTRASSAGEVGEYEPDPRRGSKLDALLNAAESDALADFAAIYVQEAVLQSAPEELVRSVSVDVDDRTVRLYVETQLVADQSPNPRTATASISVARTSA